jgi:hypothetical protein
MSIAGLEKLSAVAEQQAFFFRPLVKTSCWQVKILLNVTRNSNAAYKEL